MHWLTTYTNKVTCDPHVTPEDYNFQCHLRIFSFPSSPYVRSNGEVKGSCSLAAVLTLTPALGIAFDSTAEAVASGLGFTSCSAYAAGWSHCQSWGCSFSLICLTAAVQAVVFCLPSDFIITAKSCRFWFTCISYLKAGLSEDPCMNCRCLTWSVGWRFCCTWTIVWCVCHPGAKLLGYMAW